MKIPPPEKLAELLRFLNRKGYIAKKDEEHVIHVPNLVLRAALRERSLEKALKVAENGPSATLTDPSLKTRLRGPQKRIKSLLELLHYFKSQYKIATRQIYTSKGNDWAALRNSAQRWGLKVVSHEVPKYLFREMNDETLQEPTIGNFYKHLLGQEKLGNIKRLEQ